MSNMTDQNTELLGTKRDTIFKDINYSCMTTRDNSPEDQVISRRLKDFDEQDWELKLRAQGFENDLNADSIFFTCKEEEFEMLVDKMD